ncbi:3'-5' exonuclease [Candidatus Woesearchaeota archaeon]|nr:3'-5' exonuclease [Candidatus Woesearchaeota archaeon]
MYTVVDIETTGLSKNFHRITEIAAAKIRNGQIVDSYQTLINPQTPIPAFITQLTGINNKMVQNAPTISNVIPAFTDFLGKDVFVAHNAAFDFGFLEHNSRMHGFELQNSRVCTRKLANRLFPELPRKRLSDLCSHLNITNVQAHRAMGDVQATALVFNNMLSILHQKGISNVDDILKFERSASKKSVTPYSLLGD